MAFKQPVWRKNKSEIYLCWMERCMQVKPLAASANKAKSISQDHYSAVTGSDYTTHPWNEPPHDKTNKMTVHPAKTQISQGIRPVWLETLLSAWRKIGSLAIHWAHSEDSDQTGRMPKLIWAHRSFCWFCHDAAQIFLLSMRKTIMLKFLQSL